MVRTSIGDIFAAKISDEEKKYFQYVANDPLQLNSDVIRAFRETYDLDASPDIPDIVRGEIDFFAHCVVNLGIKMNLWEKIGKSRDIGRTEVLFRDTDDFGHKLGEPPVKVSSRWYVWRIHDQATGRVGKLEAIEEPSFYGLVYNPYSIMKLLQGDKNPANYPD